MIYGHICFGLNKGNMYDVLIAKFTKSKWAHAFFTSPPILGQEMVMEADLHGVTSMPFNVGYRNNPKQSYEIYKFKIDKNDYFGQLVTVGADLVGTVTVSEEM